MAKWGSFDFKEFEKLRDRFRNAEKEIDQFMRDFLVEMGMRALRKIKKRTPVDSGELRREWKVGQVFNQGGSYIVEIYNNTDYASFVEFGHRSGADLTKWVEGRFMMTISMKEIERD